MWPIYQQVYTSSSCFMIDISGSPEGLSSYIINVSILNQRNCFLAIS
jgi:hypothetical protein